MKNLIVFTLCFSFLTAAHSQTSNEYALEIWSAEVFSKDGFDFLELDIFNNGSEIKNPEIKILHEEVSIGKLEKKEEVEESEETKEVEETDKVEVIKVAKENKVEIEDLILKPQSIHKLELPIELPSNHEGKKIKLEIVIKHKSYKLSKKLKVKVDQ